MLALDEPGKDDEVFENAGFSFVVEKNLMKRLASITIDSNDYGFLISSSGLVKKEHSSGSCSC